MGYVSGLLNGKENVADSKGDSESGLMLTHAKVLPLLHFINRNVYFRERFVI